MSKATTKDLYFVAVKIFLEDKRGRLFIFKDRFGDWDLPGGRLRHNDFSVPLKKVVARKITEELGSKVRYTVEDKPIVFMRHERSEILSDGSREKRRIFALGYRARLIGGTVRLSKQHVRSEWVIPGKFKPTNYFAGGWLKGIKLYLKTV